MNPLFGLCNVFSTLHVTKETWISVHNSGGNLEKFTCGSHQKIEVSSMLDYHYGDFLIFPSRRLENRNFEAKFDDFSS